MFLHSNIPNQTAFPIQAHIPSEHILILVFEEIQQTEPSFREFKLALIATFSNDEVNGGYHLKLEVLLLHVDVVDGKQQPLKLLIRYPVQKQRKLFGRVQHIQAKLFRRAVSTTQHINEFEEVVDAVVGQLQNVVVVHKQQERFLNCIAKYQTEFVAESDLFFGCVALPDHFHFPEDAGKLWQLRDLYVFYIEAVARQLVVVDIQNYCVDACVDLLLTFQTLVVLFFFGSQLQVGLELYQQLRQAFIQDVDQLTALCVDLDHQFVQSPKEQAVGPLEFCFDHPKDFLPTMLGNADTLSEHHHELPIAHLQLVGILQAADLSHQPTNPFCFGGWLWWLLNHIITSEHPRIFETAERQSPPTTTVPLPPPLPSITFLPTGTS